jgi:thiosulfate/3-mercaptopyruvate sulfurtransferase
MTFTSPQCLVETSWLDAHLHDPDLRILDCTVVFVADAHGVRVASSREAWSQGHVPGSGFADLLQDLSDRNTSLPFMIPPIAQFAEATSRYGVGEGTHVVLYDACSDLWAHMWAARVWWMLRVCGFEQAAILNGGWHKWTLEGRPVSTAPSSYPPAHFLAQLCPELIVDKREVLAALGDSHQCLVNALPVEDHVGTAVRTSGSPGTERILPTGEHGREA